MSFVILGAGGFEPAAAQWVTTVESCESLVDATRIAGERAEKVCPLGVRWRIDTPIRISDGLVEGMVTVEVPIAFLADEAFEQTVLRRSDPPGRESTGVVVP